MGVKVLTRVRVKMKATYNNNNNGGKSKRGSRIILQCQCMKVTCGSNCHKNKQTKIYDGKRETIKNKRKSKK